MPSLPALRNWLANLEPPRGFRLPPRSEPAEEDAPPEDTFSPHSETVLPIETDPVGDHGVTPGTLFRILLGRGRDASEFFGANAGQLWHDLMHSLGDASDITSHQLEAIRRHATKIRISSSQYRDMVDAAFNTRRLDGKTLAELIRGGEFQKASQLVAQIVGRHGPEDKQ